MRIESKLRKVLGKVGSVLLYHLHGQQKWPGKWMPFYTPYVDKFLSGMSAKERREARWKLEQKGYAKIRRAMRNEGRTNYEVMVDEGCLKRIAADFDEPVMGVKPEPKPKQEQEEEKPKERVSPFILGGLGKDNCYDVTGDYKAKPDWHPKRDEDPTIRWFKKVWMDEE